MMIHNDNDKTKQKIQHSSLSIDQLLSTTNQTCQSRVQSSSLDCTGITTVHDYSTKKKGNKEGGFKTTTTTPNLLPLTKNTRQPIKQQGEGGEEGGSNVDW